MVFLHGWNSERGWKASRDSYGIIAPKIAKQNNCEAILLDLPGFGGSGMPPKEGWTTYDYADWLEEVMQKLKIKKCIFYAHSFGCRVVVRFLLQCPEMAEKTILTGAAGIKWPPTFREKISLFLSKKFRIAKYLVPRVIQKFVITKIFGARDWGAVPTELKMTLEKVLAEKDFRNELPKLRTNFLLIWGEDDTITPLKSGKIYKKKLPNVKLEAIEGARHGVHKTHGDLVVELVAKFLKD